MNDKMTKIIRKTITHSYEECRAVVSVAQKLGYKIVRIIPNELSADESDALVTIAERGE